MWRVAAGDGSNGPRPCGPARLYWYVMNDSDTTGTIACPVENVTVDAERCARCYFRGSDQPSCMSADRPTNNDWHFLLRAL